MAIDTLSRTIDLQNYCTQEYRYALALHISQQCNGLTSKYSLHFLAVSQISNMRPQKFCSFSVTSVLISYKLVSYKKQRVYLFSYINISQQTFVGLQDVLKTSSTRLQRNDFTSFKTSSRRLGRRKIVTLNTSLRRLDDMS